jgi:hypothetical protein
MTTAMMKLPKDTYTKIKKSQEAFKEKVERLEIDSEAAYNNAATWFANIVAHRKRVDQLKEEKTRKAANELSGARQYYKMLSEPYEKMEKVLRGAMNVYVNEQDRLAREEAAKQIEAQKKMKNTAREEQVEVLEPIEAPDLNRRTESGHVHTRTKMVIKIEDFAKVPDEFKLLDEKKAKAALAEGRQVLGLDYVEEKVVAVR